MIGTPEASEYAPYYARYTNLVGAGDIIETLEQQESATLALLGGIPEEQGVLSYAPGKWTIRELVGHVNDTERIMAYRVLRIARGDRTPIEGFEQDAYVVNSPASRMRLADLASEFASVRHATLSLLRQLVEPDWLRLGIANHHEVSVRAIAWIIAGSSAPPCRPCAPPVFF
jgi:hypothetical protein